MKRYSRVSRTLRRAMKAPSRAAIYLVKFYQATISPRIGPCCRFQPTCSQYCVLAIRKYGLTIGLLKTAYRILRCNPFSRGGYDPP